MHERSGGQLVVDALLGAGIERVFCVPGESYLAVIDALYDARAQIDLISCRHEGGAAMMAAASAQLSGRPGVAFVTRGPGATNASIAVHIARQASIPLVLGVGQVARAHRGREAFQEVDYERFFAPLAKYVHEVRNAADIPGVLAEAFAAASGGRQGPVVIAFPEDVLSQDRAPAAAPARRTATPAAIDPARYARIEHLLAQARRPLVIVGGGPWSAAACAAVEAFAGTRQVPVFSAFRRADAFDNEHECYAGFLGYGAPESAWQDLAAADCVCVLGARLDEPTTRGYACFDAGPPRLIHIHPDRTQLGRHFPTDVAIEATVADAVAAWPAAPSEPDAERRAWRRRVRDRFVAAEIPPVATGALDLGAVMRIVNEYLGRDTIVTTDAGNFSVWPLRYRRYTRPGRLVAPINGAMGYGVPAAVAAALAHPDRTVLACVGDGGMMMTGMELATALKYDAKPIVLVFNNARYGTIAMHQQRQYPGREHGNALLNPDFAAFARSFGAFGRRVAATNEFADALADARGADTAAVIELVMDPDAPP